MCKLYFIHHYYYYVYIIWLRMSNEKKSYNMKKYNMTYEKTQREKKIL